MIHSWGLEKPIDSTAVAEEVMKSDRGTSDGILILPAVIPELRQ